MGWDTQVVIIAENIESEVVSKKIGKLIFEKDSKRYESESFYLIEEELTTSIYYSYERRKYAPYWLIEEISKIYPSITFTVLGSMLDFLCGPAGIFRIKDGKTLDSYGIWGENSRRYKIIADPIENRFEIYNWFKQAGKESELRMKFISDFPLGSNNDNLVDKLIPIEETLELNQKIGNESNQTSWVKQAKFESIISFEDYQQLISNSNQTSITEESFIAFIEYSNAISRIEEEISNLVNGEIIRTNPFHLYITTFGSNHLDNEFCKSEFTCLEDIEYKLNRWENEIIEWALKQLNKNNQIRILKGSPFKWLINLIKEKKLKIT